MIGQALYRKKEQLAGSIRFRRWEEKAAIGTDRYDEMHAATLRTEAAVRRLSVALIRYQKTGSCKP